MMDRNFRFQIPDVGSELRSSAGAQSAIRNPQSAIPTDLRRPGFSFTEVLFAVMILGVGFIMIAAVFPVSLSQVKMNTEETNGAALTRSAVSYMEHDGNVYTMPGTDGRVYAFVELGRRWIAGNMVQPSDRRYAWIPLYRRPPHAPYAQLILVPVHARDVSQYEGAPNLVHNADGTTSVTASITDGGSNPDTLVFGSVPTSAVEGAFVVVAEGHAPGAADPYAATFNGNIFRLGRRLDTAGAQWELAIGSDFTPQTFPNPSNPASPITVNALDNRTGVFVIGRGDGGAGLPMDISAYTTFIQTN